HLEHNAGVRSMDLPAVEAGATRYGSLSNAGDYNYVISPAAAARLGMAPIRPIDQGLQFVLRAPAALSKADVERAKAIAARHAGASVLSVDDLGSNSSFTRTVMLLAGTAVALAILSVVLALLG